MPEELRNGLNNDAPRATSAQTEHGLGPFHRVQGREPLTNNHVVAGPYRFKVKTRRRRAFDAKVVWAADVLTDSRRLKSKQT